MIDYSASLCSIGGLEPNLPYIYRASNHGSRATVGIQDYGFVVKMRGIATRIDYFWLSWIYGDLKTSGISNSSTNP